HGPIPDGSTPAPSLHANRRSPATIVAHLHAGATVSSTPSFSGDWMAAVPEKPAPPRSCGRREAVCRLSHQPPMTHIASATELWLRRPDLPRRSTLEEPRWRRLIPAAGWRRFAPSFLH